MSKESSTKIKDLPDNTEKISSKILQDLDDNNSAVSDSSYTEDVVVVTKPKQHSDTRDDNSFLNELLCIGKDSAIVYIVLNIILNSKVMIMISNLPFVRNYEPSSFIFTTIIAAVAALMFAVAKYVVAHSL